VDNLGSKKVGGYKRLVKKGEGIVGEAGFYGQLIHSRTGQGICSTRERPGGEAL
jgi:hypothetical protein